MSLSIESNLSNPDAFYERLIDLHADISHEESLQLNEKLAKLLSDCVGDASILDQASSIAGEPIAGETAEYTAKLILLLCNHLGDAVVGRVLTAAETDAARYRTAA